MNKISDVYCYYTGGGVWIYSARYGEYFLYGTLDATIDCFPVRGEILFDYKDICEECGWIEEYEKFHPIGDEEDYYIGPNKIDYPTWQDILDSVRPIDHGRQIEYSLIKNNPDLTKKTYEMEA